MGRKLTASEETQLLIDTVREAHEVLQALYAAIRDARNLAPSLVADFDQLHHREMAQLTNHLQSEHNRAAAELNQAVKEARTQIVDWLTVAELVLDPETGSLHFLFPHGMFQEDVPLQFPEYTTKETRS